MHNDLVELGWTEEHWNRICGAVAEEAQKARIASQLLPMVGPEPGSTVAVPQYALGTRPNPEGYPRVPPEAAVPVHRLAVNSDPNLYLTTIAVNVPLRSHEVADPGLNAALGMFRRAANCIARVEDALVFNGRQQDQAPAGLGNLPEVYTVTGDGTLKGLIHFEEVDDEPPPPLRRRVIRRFTRRPDRDRNTATKTNTNFLPLDGNDVVDAIIQVIGELDSRGQQGPYACGLSQDLFAMICSPNENLVLPRDRILPFLQGPLLRASALRFRTGVVIALSGNPVEIVVGSDIAVRYLQTTMEPRYVFRVSERIALRIREANAIAVIT
jgi:uncharacterized linocin/CFP29 family protein